MDDPVTVVYQLFSNDCKSGEPFTKTFASVEEQLKWERSQDGHPWMHVERVNTDG